MAARAKAGDPEPGVLYDAVAADDDLEDDGALRSTPGRRGNQAEAGRKAAPAPSVRERGLLPRASETMAAIATAS